MVKIIIIMIVIIIYSNYNDRHSIFIYIYINYILYNNWKHMKSWESLMLQITIHQFLRWKWSLSGGSTPLRLTPGPAQASGTLSLQSANPAPWQRLTLGDGWSLGMAVVTVVAGYGGWWCLNHGWSTSWWQVMVKPWLPWIRAQGNSKFQMPRDIRRHARGSTGQIGVPQLVEAHLVPSLGWTLSHGDSSRDVSWSESQLAGRSIRNCFLQCEAKHP